MHIVESGETGADNALYFAKKHALTRKRKDEDIRSQY